MLVFGVVTVRMVLEWPTFAERHVPQAMGIHEGSDMRLITQRVDGSVEKRFQVWADPEDHVGVLQRTSMRRAQAIGVRRSAAFDDQGRGANALHDSGDQRVDGLDGCDD